MDYRARVTIGPENTNNIFDKRYWWEFWPGREFKWVAWGGIYDIGGWCESSDGGVTEEKKIRLDMSNNRTIISDNSRLVNETSRFDKHKDWSRYNQMWDTTKKSFNNNKVFYLLNFLVRRTIHILMNIHWCNCFYHILVWLAEYHNSWWIFAPFFSFGFLS